MSANGVPKMAQKKHALIIVDLQNDFIPGGALPVTDGNKIIPLVNKLLEMPFDLKVATKDWHPFDHGSFASQHPGKKPGDIVMLDGIKQILWPDHCIQKTHGSEFAAGWNSNKVDHIFHKGSEKNIDSYSTFFDNEHRRSTGLSDYLQEKGITDIYIAGLATDYCVKYSVLDSRHLGFNTYVIADACRGVNLKPGDSDRSLEEMRKAGAHIINLKDVAKLLE